MSFEFPNNHQQLTINEAIELQELGIDVTGWCFAERDGPKLLQRFSFNDLAESIRDIAGWVDSFYIRCKDDYTLVQAGSTYTYLLSVEVE
jgi:hypothetical protein